MFIIDMQGTLALATASSSSRTPGDRNCGSCMASATRSYSDGSTASVVAADSLPGTFCELISTGASRPRTGKRTRAPSALINFAVSGRHTKFTLCPASANLIPNREPYEAPMIKML